MDHKSLPLVRKFACQYAKSVSFRRTTDLTGITFPSVEHVEILPTGRGLLQFIHVITKVLDASRIISFMHMDVQKDVELAISHLGSLKSIQQIAIGFADSRFIIEALKQLRTLVSIRIAVEIETSSLLNVVTSQEPPVLWKDVNISLRNNEHTLFPLLVSRMPHLKQLTLYCPFFKCASLFLTPNSLNVS
jgi:hypothetical protein